MKGPAPAFFDFSRLAVHSATTRGWDLESTAAGYAEAGVPGISVWRDLLAGNPRKAGKLLRGKGLGIVSLCRGGFFPSPSPEKRRAAIEENLRCIQEASELEAPLLVLVCGASPGLTLETAREQIQAGIESILPQAERQGVRLAVEPLHPMYAGDRSAINTLGTANDLCDRVASPWLGVVVDVYHLWWDPELEREIARSGLSGYLLAYHVSDWLTPTRDMLEDRGLMGEGCIPLRTIRAWVEAAGFSGPCEVEIFSQRWWREPPAAFIDAIKRAHRQYV